MRGLDDRRAESKHRRAAAAFFRLAVNRFYSSRFASFSAQPLHIKLSSLTTTAHGDSSPREPDTHRRARVVLLRKQRGESCLDAELGAAPVAALGVVADLVVGAEPDPLAFWFVCVCLCCLCCVFLGRMGVRRLTAFLVVAAGELLLENKQNKSCDSRGGSGGSGATSSPAPC